MASNTHWIYSPISYITMIVVTVLLLNLCNVNTKTEQEVTRKIVIIDYPDSTFQDSQYQDMEIDTMTAMNLDSAILDSVEVYEVETTFEEEQKMIVDPEVYMEKMLAAAPIYDRPSKKAIIRYYEKDLDGNSVRSLQKYGFYIHDRPSDLKETYASNALYLGDSIKNSDILLVAYVLLKNGVELKYITEAKAHDDWKANAIEVVTDTTVLDKEILSLSYLLDHYGDH